MIRHIRRYFAIRSYALRLPGEMARRFGVCDFYTVEQVTSAAKKSGYNMGFIAYAHAIFCDRANFDAYYGPMGVACTYDGLREVVWRRYFSHLMKDFNAGAVIRWTRSDLSGDDFQESGAGIIWGCDH